MISTALALSAFELDFLYLLGSDLGI